MIVLDATTKSLELKLAASPTTEASFISCYVDVDSTTYTPGEQDGVTNGTTAVTAASSPASSVQRHIKFLSVRNRNAASVTLTVQYNNNGTVREIWKGTLDPDTTLVYTDGRGFQVFLQTGASGG